MENNKKKVLLGMSGGVDSSAAAILLRKQGYDVIGCTMILHDEEKSKTAIEDAKKVCEKIGIPHYIFDFQKDFKCEVIQKFIKEYENARTPNPCVECNKELKFKRFYEKAKELGCEYISTGHYAKIEYSEKYNQNVLRKSEADKKDQTYFLYTIPKKELNNIIFPLENFKEKTEIREIVKKEELEVATKKDSQEICFIEDDDYKRFLIENMDRKPKKGNIILKTGEKLGVHDGLIYYTIGQRKGIGISYKEPLYVVELREQTNEVVVGTEEELYANSLIANELNWQVFEKMPNEIKCFAKIRYRAKEARAIVKKIDQEKVEVIFDEPQRAITKGQSVVFYDEEGIVLGGGKII